MQITANALADTLQAKILGTHLGKGFPLKGSNIISRHKCGIARDFCLEKGVCRMHFVPAESVGVGDRKKVAEACNFCPGLFVDFAPTSVLDALAGLDKTAGQVQRSAGRLEGTAAYQQLAAGVAHKGGSRSTRVVVQGETAVAATLGSRVVYFEFGAAAHGTEGKVS